MYDLSGKQVAILVHNYFEQVELTSPKQALEEAEATVHIVAPEAGVVQGLNKIEPGDEFKVDVTMSEMKTSDYHAIVIPGGVVNSDYLRMDQSARQWVQDFNDGGKPIAAICHGPWLLVSAGLVKNRRMTSYYTLQDDIRNAGGNWVDEPMVDDGNLITSRNPGDLEAFNEALLMKLAAPGS